jgi:[ribosomal protein S18]-alanine N-acetyltransferase
MSATDLHARIRPFRPEDSDVAVAILAESPEAASWSPAGQQEILRQPGVLALVAEAASHIQGLLIARQVADEAEILNIAVRPQSRRAGYGSALLLALEEEFHRQHVARVFLEVRASNAAAIAFYRKHGFVPIDSRKAYYSHPREDAVVMEKKLTA